MSQTASRTHTPEAQSGDRCDLYLRLSTPEQLKGMSFAPQREQAEQRAHERGLVIDQVWEENETGKDEQRPMLAAMLARARNKEIKAVIVWKKARLSRKANHRNFLFDEFDKAGCEFISVGDPRHTGKYGLVVETIEGVRDEEELEIINERMTDGRI